MLIRHEVCDDLMLASKHIPKERLGSTDDCGFSPFSIDVKPKHGSPDVARDIAFQKIKSRVEGTTMVGAARHLTPTTAGRAKPGHLAVSIRLGRVGGTDGRRACSSAVRGPGFGGASAGVSPNDELFVSARRA